MTLMKSTERVETWNRNRVPRVTFSFACDADDGLWLVDHVSGTRDRLTEGEARLLDLLFGDPRR